MPLHRLVHSVFLPKHTVWHRNKQWEMVSFLALKKQEHQEREWQTSRQRSHLLVAALKTFSLCISLSWLVDRTGSDMPDGCIDSGPHMGFQHRQKERTWIWSQKAANKEHMNEWVMQQKLVQIMDSEDLSQVSYFLIWRVPRIFHCLGRDLWLEKTRRLELGNFERTY